MLSERFRTIFVHIPKNAGQSIETVFLEQHGLNWATRAALLLKRNDDPAKGPERLAHLYAREYVEYGYVSQTDFDAFYKFAVVQSVCPRGVPISLQVGDADAFFRIRARFHRQHAAGARGAQPGDAT